jgi:hypothetical protein
MNRPNAQEIRAGLEQRRQHDREEMRRQEEAMDAFAVRAVRSLTEGLRVVAEDPEPRTDEPAIDKAAATEADARQAIEARRLRAPSPTAAPLPGEKRLRAALRGIVEDYAEPLMPSDRTVGDLEAMSGIALDDADTYGLWADLQLEAALAARAAMRDVIDIVTDRAESVIIDELVAAEARIAREYPDAPRPNVPETDDHES